MRRFIEEQDQFELNFETVKQFLTDEGEGCQSTYGGASAAYLAKLASEVGAN
jgi:hypothetical protein